MNHGVRIAAFIDEGMSTKVPRMTGLTEKLSLFPRHDTGRHALKLQSKVDES